MNRQVIIFGDGEFAGLAHDYMVEDDECGYEISAFTVDDEYVDKEKFRGLPVIPFSELREEYPPSEYDGHVAISYKNINKLREDKYKQMKEVGYDLVSFISSDSHVSSKSQVGENCLILEGQTIQPGVVIGDNVMVWSGNHIGHGSKIGDHTYVSSHVCISGNVTIGKRCFLGVNATFKDFVEIGDEVFVAMDASVTKNVDSEGVVLAAQSEVLDSENSLAKRVKNKYF